jgi:hypothetical protein
MFVACQDAIAFFQGNIKQSSIGLSFWFFDALNDKNNFVINIKLIDFIYYVNIVVLNFLKAFSVYS